MGPRLNPVELHVLFFPQVKKSFRLRLVFVIKTL
jgi:hypothetical protein